MHSKPKCPVCEKVDLVLTGCSEPQSKPLTVGTFAEIRQNQDCDICRFVIEKLSENPARDAYKDGCPVIFFRWDPPEDYLYGFGPLEGEINCLACDLDHQYLTLADLKLADPNPDWIDLNRVRAWAKSCDSEHAGTCHSLTGWANTPLALAPLLLVDVVSKCLIEIPIERIPDIRYVTLSYVWGQARDILETRRGNEQDLRQKHALASPPYEPRLPNTIRDAIELVYRLDIPYLWVDRLCIVQNDPDRKLPQLEQMGAIYANAYMTLVAVDGRDANHGLRGSCPGIASPRVLGTPMLTFSPSRKTLVVEPDFAPRFGTGEWYRRGWTFQERTLSNRNLVFQQGRVFWECQGAVWTEELAYGPSSEPAARDKERDLGGTSGTLRHYNINLSRWPDLNEYEILVRSYSELLLTFPSDVLHAFTGVINTLSRSFPGGMLYGIPEYFFDYAIIWAPYTPIQRRLVHGMLDPAFPSWSWVGWTGGAINLSISLMMRQRISAGRNIMPWDNIEIYPKVNWHKVDLDTGKKHAIDNSYYETAKMRNDKAASLPDGWSRFPVTRDESTWEGFAHSNIPGYVFPWPLKITEQSSNKTAGSFKPYLSFRTSRAFLFVGARLHHEWEERVWSRAANAVVPRVSMFHLRDNNGNWAGVLESNGAEESLSASHEAWECVVVSGGIAWKDADGEPTSLVEWAQVDLIQSLPKYEFYNVLFIEWEGGIAYRKAVGRVWKEAWEQLDTSDIDVILG
ncbi:heterokaryon incompatibility protein-domain-containing protein [Nemania abortiva]|nr:heterokaryon incompatibility protein-domain-containing protein [Nemania abortiva]